MESQIEIKISVDLDKEIPCETELNCAGIAEYRVRLRCPDCENTYSYLVCNFCLTKTQNANNHGGFVHDPCSSKVIATYTKLR
jgi:hypothetical protein